MIDMFAEFKHTLRRQRGSMIGWGIGLFLYSLMMVAFYSSIGDMFSNLDEMLANYPKEMLAFFPNLQAISSPAGYLDTYFFSLMHLIIGIYTIGAFSGLLTRQEEQGILDLLLAQPISRSGMFWGRVLGVFASTLIILLVSWLGWLIPAGNVGLDLTWYQLLLPFLPLLAVLILFGVLGLVFSLLLPATRLASGLAGALLVGNFLLVGLSNINPDLESVYKLTPFYYYQGGLAANGLDWSWFLGLLTAAFLLTLPAWLLFQKRDIRVGGERTFKLTDLNPFSKRKVI
jgi:ABC-2 type transport system permease protein